MKLHFAGGACEIGASCIVLEVCGKKILFDCGLRQSANKDPLPDFRMIQDLGGIDAIIVSHAHLDHTGTLPLISKEYPWAKIYMNKVTKELVRVLLYDSLKIMNYHEGEIPLYAENDVEMMFGRVTCVNYEVEFKLYDTVYFTFHPAGHIAGASFVSMKSEEGTFFYSGDFSCFGQQTIEGARIPHNKYDTAVLESTYGDKLHANRELEEERLISLVEECITGGGRMLIPSFALGRAQEIILILKKAKNKNRLKDVPVYVDGMIRDITRVYSQNPIFLKSSLGKKILKGMEAFYDKTIIQVMDKVQRDNILNSGDPMVIIASSGMLHGGYSQLYAEYITPLEKNYLVFSGYQDEESPGHALLQLAEKEADERKLVLDQKIIPVMCRVEKIGLSAHGDKSEIKNIISLIKPGNIFLVHGEEPVIRQLGHEISESYNGNLYIPLTGESYDIGSSGGQGIRKKRIPFRMGRMETLDDNNIEKLWEFTVQNYEYRLHTIEDYICIWTGKRFINNALAVTFHRLFTKTIYFENDSKRLFLFRPKSKERIEEELKTSNIYNQQEIDEQVQKHFTSFEYKKASFYIENKKVVLLFDFPLALPGDINNAIQAFKTDTGWEVEIYRQTNTNAIEVFVLQLFSHASVKKISHYIYDGKVIVSLDGKFQINDELEVFKKKTGLSLEVQILDTQSNEKIIIYNKNDTIDSHGNIIFETSCKNRMEQNSAFSYIDSQFREEKFKLYKRGLKTDHTGKYLELSFISPIIGKRASEKISRIAEETGWKIVISRSFNQNEINHIARNLCEENGLALIRNPSFNQNNCSVTVKVEASPENEKVDIKALDDAFKHKTGCSLNIEFA